MSEPTPAELAEEDQFQAAVTQQLNDAVALLLAGGASGDAARMVEARDVLKVMLLNLDQREALTMLAIAMGVIAGLLEEKGEIRSMFGFPGESHSNS